jgi:hypothetical protein
MTITSKAFTSFVLIVLLQNGLTKLKIAGYG